MKEQMKQISIYTSKFNIPYAAATSELKNLAKPYFEFSTYFTIIPNPVKTSFEYS